MNFGFERDSGSFEDHFYCIEDIHVERSHIDHTVTENRLVKLTLDDWNGPKLDYIVELILTLYVLNFSEGT